MLLGSHGGDIVLMNTFDPRELTVLREGKGKGGSITSMWVPPVYMPNYGTAAVQISNVHSGAAGARLWATSHDMQLCVYDLEKSHRSVVHDTGDWDHWYTCVGGSIDGRFILAGDCKGSVSVVDPRKGRASTIL